MSERSTLPYMTVEEYLRFEERSQVRHEYLDGQVFARSDSNEAHNVICGNLLVRIHAHLKGTGCRVCTSGMKVHVKAANSFYYPDIVVTCEPFEAESVFYVSPSLIVEVLSPSTKQIDRREKLVAYRKLDSLREYVLIHQRKILIELYRKDASGKWQYSELRGSNELSLEALPGSLFTMPVSEIYDQLELPRLVEEECDEYDEDGDY